MIAGLLLAWIALPLWAESLRIATFGADLTRRGPGLLLRDILSDKDPQVAAVVAVIAAAQADVLLLTGVDHDHDLVALTALADRLAAAGAPYPHRFALPPNRGLRTGEDLDGDGRPGEPQGFGRFTGAEGMAILSRLPIAAEAARDFSAFAWRDLPGALVGPDVTPAQRLSTTGHWVVPVHRPGGGLLHLLAWHATPPVFDGGTGRNARRNHDETAFWLRLLEGATGPPAPFVILGNGNLDPADGDGLPGAMHALLAHPALQDPQPRSKGGAMAADPAHRGDPALDTADFRDGPGQPGNLRVDLVLPSAGLRVLDAGVIWPPPGAPLAAEAAAASRHRLVWVDLEPP